MSKYHKFGLAAFVLFLLSGIVISARAAKITSAVHENIQGTDAAASVSEYEKTDIAQVFITTDQIISKLGYVKATIAVVDAEGGSSETIEDEDASIRVRGNSTSTLAKLPYNIKFSSSVPLLGMRSGKKWCLLANYLDTSLMRNKLAYDFAESLGLAYSCETRYADVWLNGAYLGNYLIATPVKTGKNGVDIDTAKNEFLLEIEAERSEEDATYVYSQIYRLKVDEPEMITQEQSEFLSSFFAKSEEAMKSGDYSKIRKYVDVDSFIDFYILQELFKNVDVNYSSTRFYIKDGKLYAGPLWDFDLTCGNVSTNPRYPHYLIYNNYELYGNHSCNSCEGLWALYSGKEQNYENSWIGLLMECKEFREAFVQRYEELQNRIENLYENNENGKNHIDLLLNQYGNSFDRNNEKWPVQLMRYSPLYRDDETTFEDSVSYLRSWLKNRNEWLLDELQAK